MTSEQITVTLPLTEQGLNVVLVALLIAVLSGVVWLALGREGDKAARDRARDPARRALEVFGWIYAPIWLLIFAGTLWALWLVFSGVESPIALDGFRSLGLGALIAALLGAPFVIWGTIIRQRTVDLQAEAHMNDKITTAADSLFSRREVSLPVTSSAEGEATGTKAFVNVWQDDIVKRSGAIDRFEGLIHERPEIAPRVASLLALYVRQMSHETAPKKHSRQKFLELTEPDDGSPPASEDQALSELEASPEDVSVESLKDWASKLEPVRADIEKAMQLLGKIYTDISLKAELPRLDLRGANLQGFDLAGVNLRGANFSQCWANGANFKDVDLRDADFSFARLEGANFSGARLDKARMLSSWLEGAVLSGARFEGADLRGTRLEGAALRWARLEGADLRMARLEGADLSGARLEGGILIQARLEGALLFGAGMDKNTSLIFVALEGAALRGGDWSRVAISRDQVTSAFGDASVILPEGIDPPAHWPNWVLPDFGKHDFHDEWRKWQKNPDSYPTPPRPTD